MSAQNTTHAKTWNTKKLRAFKKRSPAETLTMLTCYDYQTACLLNESAIDMVLVGDSLGNVILGYETTVPVETSVMEIFAAAVKRGARNKFVVADMPFGSYPTLEMGLKNAIGLFQKSQVEALKLEGAFPETLEIIQRLTHTGIPVMGHIGLTPQSVHEQGGYYTHGKDQDSADELLRQAIALEKAGVFSLVLECVETKLAKKITETLKIPTIGIGSGQDTDGQVLVINDLLKMGPTTPPKFCVPLANLFDLKKDLIKQYISREQER